MKTKICLALSAFLLCGLSTAYGQNGTVQLPVVRNFSVNTTVSVPDRGSALLGSVSRAASGSKNIGFFNPESSVGRAISHAGATSHVTIHDFDAMDQFLLNQGKPNADLLYRFSSKDAAAAYSQLAGNGVRQRSTKRTTMLLKRSPTSKISRSLALGERAEKQGKLPLACLHYRIAEKYGSATARDKLEKLNQQKRNLVVNRK